MKKEIVMSNGNLEIRIDMRDVNIKLPTGVTRSIISHIDELAWMGNGGGDDSDAALRIYEREIKFLKTLLIKEQAVLEEVKEWKEPWHD